MRTKAFALSMGLAASVWLAGCQGTSSSKVSQTGTGGSCTSKTCRETSTASAIKTAKVEKSSRVTAKASPAPVAAESCTTCAKSAEKAPQEGIVQASATCSTCAASTGGVVRDPLAINEALATLPPGQHQVMMMQPNGKLEPQTVVVPTGQAYADQNPAPTGLPHASALPAGSAYGPGVEVVAGQAVELPTSLPGERTEKNNVMTVRFGQANNYQVVVGQLSQFRRAWKLRYAAIESDDKYGGSLSLTGENLDHLKDGQMVRVEGMVLPSEDRASGARYQVHRIEVIEPDVK